MRGVTIFGTAAFLLTMCLVSSQGQSCGEDISACSKESEGKKISHHGRVWTQKKIGNAYHAEQCSVVIIDEYFVLTATRCVYNKNSVQVYTGIDIGNPYEVDKFEFTKTKEGQIDLKGMALVKLKKPIKMTKGVGTICLPHKGEKIDNKELFLTGYMENRETYVTSKVKGISHEDSECKKAFIKHEISKSKKVICVKQIGQKILSMDRGAPLSGSKDGKCVLYGMSYFPSSLGDIKIELSIADKVEWIREHMKK